MAIGYEHPNGLFYRRACEAMGIDPENNPNYKGGYKEMTRTKLADKSYDYLDKLRLSIENNPRNKAFGFYLYTLPARKRLSDIAWAITYKIQRERDKN